MMSDVYDKFELFKQIINKEMNHLFIVLFILAVILSYVISHIENLRKQS